MAQDLRSYLDLVKRRKPGDFEIVSKPVDPRFEITALVVKLEREAKRRPVLLFENVKGTRFPVLTNLHASRPRLAAAMNAAPEATQATYLRAMDKPLVPKIVPSGPVHEVVEVVDLPLADPELRIRCGAALYEPPDRLRAGRSREGGQLVQVFLADPGPNADQHGALVGDRAPRRRDRRLDDTVDRSRRRGPGLS